MFDFSKRTWVEINLDSVEENIKNALCASGGKEIMGVVKANAYGHGDIEIAGKLMSLGVKRFAVSNICEAVHLRKNAIAGDILILGYTPREDFSKLAEFDIIQALPNLEYAYALSEFAEKGGKKIRCHVKFDTGMGRIGLQCRDEKHLGEEIKAISQLEGIFAEGAFTHFAVADSMRPEDVEYTKGQNELFVKASRLLQSCLGREIACHNANSAGGIFYKDFPGKIHRLGISLYGLTPDPALEMPYTLAPVMELKSVISMVKTVKAGDSISYGRTYTAKKDTVVATVPIGYADGLRRELSNKGEMLVRGKRAKIIGRVCMDQVMLDVTDICGACEGDTVTVFGKGLPVEEMAGLCGTINYEIVCGIAMRVPRVYMEKGEIIDVKNYI